MFAGGGGRQTQTDAPRASPQILVKSSGTNVCGGVTSASGASLASGVAQIASDGCTDLWGWLYAPRVSCGPCCTHPVCLVRVAVCTPCALRGAGCMHPVCLMGVAVWIPCVTVQRMLRRNGMWRGEACSGMPYPLHLERMAARTGSW